MDACHELSPNINDILCLDILLKIFKSITLRELFPLRRVCQSWNEIINQHILVPRKELIICLASYSTNKYFRREHISECYLVKNYNQLLLLFEYHDLLESLKVFNFVLLDDWFRIIPSHNLRTLAFVECTFFPPPSDFIHAFKQVTNLELINCDIRDEDIDIIGKNMKQIQHLNVSCNGLLTGGHIDSFSITLKSLIMNNCYGLVEYTLVDCLRNLYRKGAQLEVLNLKYLNNNIFSQNLIYIFALTKMKELKLLKLTSEKILPKLIQLQPDIFNIEKLVFYEYCTFNENSGIISDMFFNWFFDRQYHCLRHLSIIKLNSKHLNDDGFNKCLLACPNIVSLKLVNLSSLTQRSLSNISNIATLKRIVFVNINLNDEIVIKILDQCNELKSLKIDFPDDEIVKPYNLTERIILHCIALCNRFSERRLEIKIIRSLLPSHKLFTIPTNLSIEIVKSRFLIRKRAIYVDEPEQM